MTEEMNNNLYFLPNCIKYKDRIKHDLTYVYVNTSYYSKTKSHTCLTMRHELSINVPMTKKSDITCLLKGLGFADTNPEGCTKLNQKDGEVFFYVNKLVGEKVVHNDQCVVKYPWFNDVLKIIQKYDSSYTEDMLIAQRVNEFGILNWNTSVVKTIIPGNVARVPIFDDHVMTLKIGIVDLVVPLCSKKVDTALEKIFALIDN